MASTMARAQRVETFNQAVELEEMLEELARLRARLLAGLDAYESRLRAERERLMRCAVTGEDPRAPEQLAMPLDATTVGRAPVRDGEPPAGRASEGKSIDSEHPEPEPPKGGGKRRRRSSEDPSTKGDKRAKAARAARAATAPARANASTEETALAEGLVPAPRVPCCGCGHSIADHLDGSGPCSGKGARGSKCQCQSFRPLAETLYVRGLSGWVMFPAAGAGGRARILQFQGKETLPLEWVPDYGLAFREGEGLRHVLSYLGNSTLVHMKDPQWTWVPVEVLRALAEELGAKWPKKTSGQPPEEPPQERPISGLKRIEDLTTEDEWTRHVENLGRLNGRGIPAEPEFSDIDATVLLDAELWPRKQGEEYQDTVEVSGTRSACQACGTRERPRARLDFARKHRPKGARSWRADRVSGAGGIYFTVWLCRACCTPEGLERAKREGEEPRPGQPTDTPKADMTTPAECDGCGAELPASQLQPVGVGETRGFYCPGCRADMDDQGTTTSPVPSSDTTPRANDPTRPVDSFGRPWPAVDEVRFPGWFVEVTPGWSAPKGGGRLDEFLWVDVAGPDDQRLQNLKWYPPVEGREGRVVLDPGVLIRIPYTASLPADVIAGLVGYLTAHFPASEEQKQAEKEAGGGTKKKRGRQRRSESARAAETRTDGATSAPAVRPLKVSAIEGEWGFTVTALEGSAGVCHVYYFRDGQEVAGPFEWTDASRKVRRTEETRPKRPGISPDWVPADDEATLLQAVTLLLREERLRNGKAVLGAGGQGEDAS